MANSQQLRHRKLHKMHGDIENLVVRDPQTAAASANGNSMSNAKSAATVNSQTDTATQPLSTFLSVVFVTASPTFTGDVAGYTTLTPPAEQSSPQPSVTYDVTEPQNFGGSSSQYVWTPASSSAAAGLESTQAAPATSWEAATTYVPSTTNTALGMGESSLARSSTLPTSIAVAISSSTFVSSYISSRMASRSLATMAPSSTASAAASSSGGMTSGGKAGLAIGVILVLALVAGGVLWFYWKKKKHTRKWHKTDDEKVGFGAAAAPVAAKTDSKKPLVAGGEKQDSSAPRLSLRPVTQFIPDLAGAKKRLSQVNPLNKMNKPAGMAVAGADRNLTPGNPNGSPWERRAGGGTAANPFKDPVNPFGDQAKSISPPNVTVTPPLSDDGSSIDAGTGVAVGVATGAAGAAMLAGAAKNVHGQPRNGSAGRAGLPTAAGGAPPGNVHRVQLDFKPSMEDELELGAGQLVRLLHEYDDGWALCVRLDRSQQGVAPRTCLSVRPVKPRPTNGSPRMGQNGRPMSPAQSRPMSPASGPGPRPQSPARSLGPSRPGTANSNHPLSAPSQGPQPMLPQGSNQMAPGQFNQAPRPLSPGPVTRSPTQQPTRSQSPGPYGARTGPPPMTTEKRRRSNSASAVQARRNSPPGSSPLARDEPMPGWKPPKPQNSARTGPGVAF